MEKNICKCEKIERVMKNYYKQAQSENIKRGLKKKKVNLPCKEK